MENYKKVIGFANYEVSNLGNVRNIKTSKILKPCKFKNTDYYYLDLCTFGKKSRYLLHRLVISTFTDNCNLELQVNHINGDKSDNSLENLEWCNRSENQKHSILIGLRHTRGEKNSQSKLSEKNVLGIFNDKRIYKEISKEYDISIPTISDIKRGYSWTHITKLDNCKKRR